jgi:hypothetical protein
MLHYTACWVQCQYSYQMSAQYSTVQYSTQYSTVQYSTVQHSTQYIVQYLLMLVMNPTLPAAPGTLYHLVVSTDGLGLGQKG